MLRTLLVVACLAAGAGANAQTTNKPAKITEKQGESKIDYTQAGAPMPPLVLVAYHDAAPKKADTTTATGNEEPAAKQKTKRKKHTGKQTPDLHKNHYITDKDLDDGANLVTMMFNPNCSHCQDETEMLEKNMALFKKSKLILMADLKVRIYLPNFAQSFHVLEYPGIYLGMDSSGFINNVFLYQALPQINIYGHDRKLLKTYTGEITMDSLKQYIE